MKKFSLFKRTRQKVGLGSTEIKKQNIIPHLLLAIFVVVSLTAINISLSSRSAGWVGYTFPNLNVGDISPKREIAPFDFNVPKPERQLEMERAREAAAVLPVFRLDQRVFTDITSRIDTLFIEIQALASSDVSDSVGNALNRFVLWELTDAQIDSLIRVVKSKPRSLTRSINRAMKESFANISDFLIIPNREYIENITDNFFVLANGDSVSVEMTIEVESAGEFLRIAFRDEIGNKVSGNDLQTLQDIIVRFLKPNLIYDENLTAERREKARQEVPVYSASFKKNERIIDANVLVTKMQLEALDVLRKEQARRSFSENRFRHYLTGVGNTLIALGIIGIVTGFLYLYRRKTFRSFSRLLLLVLVSSLPVLTAFYSAWSGSISVFLIPVGLSAILVTILFDTEMGIVVTLAISLIVSSLLSEFGTRMEVVYFLSSCIGVFTVGNVRHRKEFYRSMVFIPLVMAVSIAATNDWITHTEYTDVGFDMFLGAVNGFLCPVIAIGVLPLLESLFKVTTNITLLELSDLNNPLLRELAVKAPGTFSGVLVVGTLAESAAERIGANPLLCRVGSYYHDIGKMSNAEYFIENQMGDRNPHDRLNPHMSALILATHVKEGYELGLKYGLPDAILDIIKQHHGTSLMESIYHKAKDQAGDEPVDESAFRYPGPKPQTREAAIVMLADLSEAASRSVKEKSPVRLKAVLNTIIQKRFVDGELDECELTLKDLHNIAESFMPILVGSHHGRIEYPWQKEQETAAGGKNGTAKTAVNPAPVQEDRKTFSPTGNKKRGGNT